MPFPMVHLGMAGLILENAPGTIEHRAFYIGSLAPDSVHFRPNYTGAYKVKSHVCIDGWKWGLSEDNEAWTENAMRFFREHRDRVNYSFLCGYCSHILADIAWNRRFWLPFIKGHPEAFDPGDVYGSGMHRDCYEIDTRFYHQLENKQKIWDLLEDCTGFDVPGVVSASETERMISSILHEQYSNRPIDQGYAFRYINMDQMKEFVNEEYVNIANCLFAQEN